MNAFKKFIGAVQEDYRSVQRYRQKYHQESVSIYRLPIDMFRKIGFQTMTAIRLMQLTADLKIPVLPQVMSRLCRHLYGIEVHWHTKMEPGISIVHGQGIVLSHAAHVSRGCILFHQVTLGEGIDPQSRQTGAPRLGKDVHVGPGAILLGPIEVGEGSKIMAGSVLTHSVPPFSLVQPAACQVRSRKEIKGSL